MKLQRVVIKVGTQVLVDTNGVVDIAHLKTITDCIADLKAKKLDVVVVSSGAIGLGRARLGMKPPLTISEKQASAAVGQGVLMRMYDHLLDERKIACGQILVTANDFTNRSSFLHLRETFETLLKFGVVPIVNENDSVSISELQENEQTSFSDNDKLSAIVATKIEADLLIILSNVDGVYTKNPKVDPKAERVRILKDLKEILKINAEGISDLGRGGMAAKLEAARTAAVCGVPVVITSPNKSELFKKLGKEWEPEQVAEYGTVVVAAKKLKGIKKWIGTSSGYKAVVTINQGARDALVERNASLLSVGVIKIKGDFEAGEIISVRDELGGELARGLSRVSSKEVVEIIEKPKNEVSKNSKVLIHKDELALFFEKETTIGESK